MSRDAEPQAPPEAPDARQQELLAWRDTREHAFPLVPIPAKPKPPAPPEAPKPPGKARREPRVWLPPPTADDLEGLHHPPSRLDAWADGSGWRDLSGEKRQAGAGVALLADGVLVCEMAAPIGVGTNNRAEVEAIGRAVGLAMRFALGVQLPRWLRSDAYEPPPRPPLTVHSDSEWALAAVTPTCEWNIRDVDLRAVVERARQVIVLYGAVALVHCKGHRKLPGLNPADEAEIRGNNRVDELAKIGRLLGEARAEQARAGGGG